MPAKDISQDDERAPLLQDRHLVDGGEGGDSREVLKMNDDDPENPRHWPRSRKLVNTAVIALMSVLSPLASSMFTPGIGDIAKGLNTDDTTVIGCTTGFVIMLGLGPLFLAPLSETFGRRRLYIICFTIFSLLQIPSALSPNIETLIAMRTLSGFFGAVGIANGGGTISDMFMPSERASIFGWYLLGPLLGPTIGPLAGGVIVKRLGWRWIFWVLTIVCMLNTIAGFLFLKETYAPIILQQRKARLEQEQDAPNKYSIEGQSDESLNRKLLKSLSRPFRILTQPIVLTMSLYQALLFSTTYSLYTNFEDIYKGQYGFNTEQVGLMYLGPGLGNLVAVWFLVPRIDTVFNALTKRNNEKSKPEFRLPLANIGAVFIPISLFWFAWAVEYNTPWYVSIISTFFFGVGMVMILNTSQNYYIDSFEKYAASAIAAGAAFRSLIGGVVPLLVPGLIKSIGYGWSISIFGFVSVLLAPAPLIFYYYGGRVREKFSVNLD
ncbi:hypothetical protein AMS68_000297 [Peltaster fructicola]|uniref:Major facilitator superfamily (MFS) profile domain-containing protein n=1 Tax=Peltaster fructicola TaxID=286661 RepID=A0A6H0XJT2_9PEZI|nr:hypothetical protein AMS68_000297 [Peltaster fructicola]